MGIIESIISNLFLISFAVEQSIYYLTFLSYSIRGGKKLDVLTVSWTLSVKILIDLFFEF